MHTEVMTFFNNFLQNVQPTMINHSSWPIKQRERERERESPQYVKVKIYFMCLEPSSRGMREVREVKHKTHSHLNTFKGFFLKENKTSFISSSLSLTKQKYTYTRALMQLHTKPKNITLFFLLSSLTLPISLCCVK